jgi:hypothetical protein
MAILLAVTVLVGLLVPLEHFGLPRSSRSVRVGNEGDHPRRPDEPDGMQAQVGLFTASFVRDRLRALQAELQRLDANPDVFAKAFHTLVARSAYEALLAEATTDSEQPWWSVGEVVDADALSLSGGLREVIDL